MYPASPVSTHITQQNQSEITATNETQVSEIALNALRVLSVLLLAAGVGCLIASLVVPAIGLLVTAAAALIWGFSCSTTTAPLSEGDLPDATTSRTHNLSNPDTSATANIHESSDTENSQVDHPSAVANAPSEEPDIDLSPTIKSFMKYCQENFPDAVAINVNEVTYVFDPKDSTGMSIKQKDGGGNLLVVSNDLSL